MDHQGANDKTFIWEEKLLARMSEQASGPAGRRKVMRILRCFSSVLRGETISK